MKISYDKDVDALYIEISSKKIVESEEIEEDVIADYDENNNIVGIEILHCLTKNRSTIMPVVKELEGALA
ncbi:MAG TPA: DUF2283 domain-containing protein [Thermodesulfovibrionia bacterium]|nr:DUF2283 domain-containing protein [Thermodesulfovibrionia bacterium]